MFDGGKITKWKQGDYEFSIRAFDPFYSMEVLGDLQKLLVPAIGGAATGIATQQGSDIIAATGGALKQLAMTMDGKTLRHACEILLDSEYIGAKKKDDKQFSRVDRDTLSQIYWGRPWDMLALCYKVFEVNFLDFSQSSSVPTGVREFVEGILAAFQDAAGSTLIASSSSTGQ